MTNAVLPFDRPQRSASLNPRVALAVIFGHVGKALRSTGRGLGYWLLWAHVPEPRGPQELLAMADRLSETQPGYASDLRAAVERSQQAPKA